MYEGNLENAIAISASFHTNQNYQKFYEGLGVKVNGFTGIYDLIADMAKTLTEYEKSHGDNPWDNGLAGRDWMEFVDDYVDEYINCSLAAMQPPLPRDIIKSLEEGV